MPEAKQTYVAQPPSDCCLTGHLHDGEPRGTVEKVGGLDTYISRPAEGKATGHVLLYFPDVWGFFKNGFLVMDSFADAGFTVFGIDYFEGDYIQKHRRDPNDRNSVLPGFDFTAWANKWAAFAKEHVPIWVEAVKEKYGSASTKYACTGYVIPLPELPRSCLTASRYCFGAPYVCDQLAEGGICSAGAFAHPAFLKDEHFRNLKRVFLLRSI
jgi:dienelactone hydrolase